MQDDAPSLLPKSKRFNTIETVNSMFRE